MCVCEVCGCVCVCVCVSVCVCPSKSACTTSSSYLCMTLNNPLSLYSGWDCMPEYRDRGLGWGVVRGLVTHLGLRIGTHNLFLHTCDSRVGLTQLFFEGCNEGWFACLQDCLLTLTWYSALKLSWTQKSIKGKKKHIGKYVYFQNNKKKRRSGKGRCHAKTMMSTKANERLK